jgi:hypothetical protein
MEVNYFSILFILYHQDPSLHKELPQHIFSKIEFPMRKYQLFHHKLFLKIIIEPYR